MYQPLADILRPTSLDEVYGQEHILGPGGLLRRIIESGAVPNMIFYGPSGVGKTTVANIIAKKTQRKLCRLNATTASSSDIKEIVSQLDTFLAPNGILLYLDEIQYFTKKQQQTLLEHIERGAITLIASTTENPYFYIYNAVLSRSTVFEFKPVSPAGAEKAIRRAIAYEVEKTGLTADIPDDVIAQMAKSCGGDLRKAINAVELLFSAAAAQDGKITITMDDALAVSQKSSMRYDREGDQHFDVVSALMKSLRGSDPDAALHYLARLLEAGDLSGACRRILCSASEDIGMAYPQAIPEGRLPLAEACILLATAPKSNSVVMAIDAAVKDVRAGISGDLPREMQNVHADGTGFERDQGYRYPHDYPHHWVKQQYLPDELKDRVYYHYGDNKTEEAARRYWEAIMKGAK